MNPVITGTFEISDPERIVVFPSFKPVDEILQVGDITGGERESTVAADIVIVIVIVIVIGFRRRFLAC